jgi:hypothetical protein
VSTIPYETSFQDALEDNVANNVANVTFATPDDDNDDVPANLASAVQDLVGQNVDYIVTLGGVNSYNAAADTHNNPNTPFFSLMGEEPSPPNNCWGGVSLESWASNGKRIKYLISKGYNTRGAISLYYDQNSGMSGHEINDWTNNLYPKYLTAGGDHILVQTPVKAMRIDGTNNDQDFAYTVNHIQSAAVIVSAAPFLHKNHNKLVDALNNRMVNGNYVYACYPLRQYERAKPRPNHATVYNQKLDDAITTLAEVITAAITAGQQQPFTTQGIGTPKDIT